MVATGAAPERQFFQIVLNETEVTTNRTENVRVAQEEAVLSLLPTIRRELPNGNDSLPKAFSSVRLSQSSALLMMVAGICGGLGLDPSNRCIPRSRSFAG